MRHGAIKSWFRLSDNRSLVRTLAWLIVIVAFVTGLMAIAYRVKRKLSPAEYEGKVVDKWVGYHDSETGSSPYFRLILETDDGRRITVAVDQQTFDRAKVGMRIRKTQSGIELNNAPGAASAGEGSQGARNQILRRGRVARVNQLQPAPPGAAVGTWHAILKARGNHKRWTIESTNRRSFIATNSPDSSTQSSRT